MYFEALGVEEEKLFFHADQVRSRTREMAPPLPLPCLRRSSYLPRQIMRGMYEMYLEVWLRHFPRDNVLVVKAEDYFSNPGEALKKMFAFLGLSAPSEEQLAASVKAGGKGTSYVKDRYRRGDEGSLVHVVDLLISNHRVPNGASRHSIPLRVLFRCPP